MKIRWILDHFIRAQDRNGNRYFLTRVTSTKTGKELWFEPYDVACSPFPNHVGVHETETILKPREFGKLANLKPHLIEGPDDVRAAIAALEDE